MWSLRRGLAAAAAGGLRKLPPRLVDPPPPAFTCWSPFTESNYAKNLTGSYPRQNNWKLLEDPELPELVRLYDQCCRSCRNASEGSDSNRFYPKGNLLNSTKAKVPIKLDNTKLNIPTPYSLDKIRSPGSKQALKKGKFDNTPDISRDNKISLQKNANGTPSSTTNKKSFQFSKRPSKQQAIGSRKSSKIKNIFGNSDETFRSYKSSQSKEFLRTLKIPKYPGYPGEPWNAGMPDRPGPLRDHYSETRKYFEGFRSPHSKHSLKASRSSSRRSKKSSFFHAYQPKPRRYSEELSIPEEEMEEEEEQPQLRRFRKSLFGSIHSSKSNISHLGNYIPEGNATNTLICHQFEPIDLVKHRKDFLASHSQKPFVTQSVWPKIWPKPLEHRSRNAKSEDSSLREPVPVKKHPKRRRLCEATSCQPQSCPIKCLKYHSFTMKNFHICDEICGRRSKKAVASQTEALPVGCELCNLCRPYSQPDEPSMVKMKQRQNREALKRYYLKMRQREKSEKPPEPKGSRDQMRRQLEQCQLALALCGQLVEAQLHLCRIRTRKKGCSGVPEPKQC